MTLEEKDELLKKHILDVADKYGCILVSAYDADQTHKNRRNTKRARFLEEIIQDNHLAYCRIVENISKVESAYYFVIMQKTEIVKQILAEYEQHFKVLNYYENLTELLEGRHFIHPQSQNEIKLFHQRREICLLQKDVNLPPDNIGCWTIRKFIGAYVCCYYDGNLLCSLHYPDDECSEYIVTIGTIRPVGVMYKRKGFPTMEEAMEFMKHWR